LMVRVGRRGLWGSLERMGKGRGRGKGRMGFRRVCRSRPGLAVCDDKMDDSA